MVSFFSRGGAEPATGAEAGAPAECDPVECDPAEGATAGRRLIKV